VRRFIQVEHPYTEQLLDYDDPCSNFSSLGVPICKKLFTQLHAIECRINAEDPYNDFRPSPGKITTLHMPGGHEFD
jgi:acetyl-CoA carboxylase biotin carboxylase subunit